MPTSRVEAFSDGVLAIIITIMVLTLKTPQGDTLGALWASAGVPLLSYLLSFLYVGIYWNNHHHLFQSVEVVTGASLWANLGLLFALSLLPFATDWADATDLARTPVAVYGAVLLLCATAYSVLQAVLVRAQPEGSAARRALRLGGSGTSTKERVSMALYAGGILAASLDGVVLPAGPGVGTALACYGAVAVLWMVPSRSVEREVGRRLTPPAG